MQDAKTNQNIYIGRRLSEGRRLRKVSQQQLASHLNLSFQQIQKYEKGESKISFSSMLTISRILKLPVTYFSQDILPESNQFSQQLTSESLQLLEFYNQFPKSQRLALLDLIKSFHR